ncbi:MAG: hypothetical protein KKE04_00505 [Candidatus Thermoplasmatota archaeon]|nr:hypothetical protein [Candidatus Thermoplasmatota archaeon]
MEGIKIVNEVEFEEVKKPGFLERFKSLFRRKTERVVAEQPGIAILPMEPGVAEPDMLKPAEVKPIETEMLKPAENIPVEYKPLNEVIKTEQKTEPMVRILPREENQFVAGEKPLVEVVKPVKLERSILGFEEEKEIVKLEDRLRKTRLLFEKKLKEKLEELGRRKIEIEQTMILESHTKKDIELIRKEEILNKKEKEIDAIIRGYQLEREDELNKRERELITKEKELGGRVEEKIDEEVKKLLKVLDELLGKLPKEIIDKFVKSEEYKLYEKVLERYGV